MAEGTKKEVLSWAKTLVSAIVIALIITQVIIVNAKVPSESMENTIMTDDRIVASRLSYVFEEPEFGDVVVFKAPDKDKVLYVKRIIGMPDDHIEIKEGLVYRNGELLTEDYIKEPMNIENNPQNFDVPQGAYFMMGDNRNHSGDARKWHNTFVYKEKILGKVFFKYFPKIEKIADLQYRRQ